MQLFLSSFVASSPKNLWVSTPGQSFNSLIQIPILEGETGGFISEIPSTYKYFETLPVSLHSDFNEKMMYTSQFVYVKFAVNNYGGLKISIANQLNKLLKQTV